MTPEEAIQLLHRAGCPPEVIRHSQAVAKVARALAGKMGADPRLVEVGALLHDIGRCKTHDITHGVVGAQLLRDYGVSEEIAWIVERHVGAGIPREEARDLGLPPGDFVPRTREEKIVAHADNLVLGDQQITLEERIGFWRERGLPQNIIERAEKLARDVDNTRL